MTSPATAATQTPDTPAGEAPAILATRRHCEADGVGLSHYILVDRAAAPSDPTPDDAA